MSKKYSIIYLVVLTFLTTLITCSENKNFELAEFDGGFVSVDDYIEHFLLSTKYKPDVKPTIENLREIVQNKALEKLSLFEAQKLKIDQDSLYQHVMSNNERRLLFQSFVKTEITDSIINDSLVNKFYENFSPQYRMSYIMRPFLNSSSEEFHKNQQKEIESAYKDLKSGKDFKTVVEKYSQDITTNKKSGDLGWVIRESLGDENLRIAMDTLEQNEFSKPIRGIGGYYILRKGEKREVKVPKLDEVKNKIWQTLYHSRKAYLDIAADEKFENLAKKYHFVFYENKVDSIIHEITNGKINNDFSTINFEDLSQKDKNIIIAKYDDGNIFMNDLFVDKKRSPTNKSEFLKKFNLVAQQHLFSLYAKEIGLDKNDALNKQLNSMKNSMLSSILYQKLVKNKVEEYLNDGDKTTKLEKVKKRSEIEKSLRTEYENKLKNEYHFNFIENGFNKAIKLAQEKKEKQNLELTN